MTLLAQAILALVVGGFVLAPLWLRRGERVWRESREEARGRSIAERKERLYGTILDLDFDRDSGKISTEDHARMRDETMKEVLQVLKEEDAAGPAPKRAPAAHAGAAPRDDDVERLIAEYKRRRSEASGAART